MIDVAEFEVFVGEVEPGLRRALLGAVGIDRVEDAVAEALGFAFERWDEVSVSANPVGYLYRVGQSRSRQRRRPRLVRREPDTIPEVEPALVGALADLPVTQRTAVWLAHGCGWTHREIADVMETSVSTVATHVSRGLDRLRSDLGVMNDAQS